MELYFYHARISGIDSTNGMSRNRREKLLNSRQNRTYYCVYNMVIIQETRSFIYTFFLSMRSKNRFNHTHIKHC